MEEVSTNKSYHEIAVELLRWFEYYDKECKACCMNEDYTVVSNSGEIWDIRDYEIIQYNDIRVLIVCTTHKFIDKVFQLSQAGLGKLLEHLEERNRFEKCLSRLDIKLYEAIFNFLFFQELDGLDDILSDFGNYNKLVKEIKRWKEYFEVFKEQEVAAIKEPQQDNDLEAVDDDIVLPSGLDNDEAKELFKRAIKAGLMEKVDGGFKWKKAKWLLAYFAELVSDKFKLGKGEYNGKPRKSWKPFEVIFGIKKLGNRKNDYQKGGNLPFDYKLIDSLFEE